MKARSFQTNFTGGEISPRAFARTDVARYANAAAGIQNMVVGVRGEATRRRGTYYAGPVKSHTGRVRLVRFEVSTIAAYVIEFGHLYARFWRNRAPVESSPGVPVEVVTPYTEAQLRELRFAQSADVLYICHPSHAPRKLSRTSPTSFSLSTVFFYNGPWQPENDSATTLAPSAKAGTLTITASASLFTADDVGRLISLWDLALQWTASTAYPVGEVVYAYYAGVSRLYRCVQAGTSAAANVTTGVEPPFDKNAPNEETDAVRDNTVVWQYLGRGQSAWGWGTITAVGSATSATVVGSETFPGLNATRRWRLGEWGGSRGWPAAMTFHAGRTVWAGSLARPQTVWTSETGDFERMSPSEIDDAVLDTNAITFTLDDDQVNSVRWLASFNRGLFLGAPSGEFVVNARNQSAALSPSNVQADRRGDRGSSTVTPGMRAGTAILFVSRGGRKLREFVYDFSTDAFKAADLTVLAEHITGGGIVDITRQDEPVGVLWLVRDDGALLSLTYDQDEEVRAWSRHVIGGSGAAVESVACVPGPDGTDDDVYVAVRRTIGGQTRRFIEWIGPTFDGARESQAAGFFVDAGLTYSGAPATVISGLGHLEGETVAICADGAVRPLQAVSGGSITLAAPAASVVHVGLPFASYIETLRPEMPMQDGTLQARRQRIVRMWLRLHESKGGAVVRGGASEALIYRIAADPMTQAVPLFSGDYEIVPPAGWDRGSSVRVTTSDPVPFTVLGLIFEVQSDD
jgi:hypothetical protein